MKRTNLVLDEALLEEALKLSGERTYSAAVNLALGELVRRRKARRILDFTGSGIWEGALAEMRRDAPVRKGKGGRRPGARSPRP
jgi:Arc/MetJ family transcription regulator